jgi:hypothetical protein
MKCEDCKFWKAGVLNLEGLCRKYAPRAIVASCGVGEHPEYENDWAQTMAGDYCGEFESKQ